MNLFTEAELISLGQKIGKNLKAPAVIELIGDVGAGKTTLTRGIASGLGVKDPVTSPSFTISKRYAYAKNSKAYALAHYDFYRLKDPGLMVEDLAENLASDDTITIIEWGESIAEILPKNHLTFTITLNEDGSRKITGVPDSLINQKGK